MVLSQFSLSWDSYKSSICNGFSTLQQNGEFVDMTIAADGHFVKVHQMLVALASPYLKDLITSAPCQHPVIFLNNVSQKVLGLLLEYIYTGEAIVPADHFASFAETAKSLHIRGLESIGTGAFPVKVQLDETETSHITGQKRLVVASARDKSDEVGLPVNATKIFVKRGPSISSQAMSNTTVDEDTHEYAELMDDSHIDDSDHAFTIEDDTKKDLNINNDKLKHNSSSSSKLQFTVSIRGSLQVILNRYIYNVHSTTRTGLRRWRCVDYRNNKCTAYLTTKGNVVMTRANPHNHGFHDKKILSKIEKKAIYSAIEEVEAYKEKEMENEQNTGKCADDNDISLNNEGFMSDFDQDIDVKNCDVKMKET